MTKEDYRDLKAEIQDIKKAQKNFVTKDELRKFKSELSSEMSKFATKDDLKGFATKDDLKSELSKYATKKDLERFATKEDLKNYPTKKDLEQFATKDFLNHKLNIMGGSIAQILNTITENEDRSVGNHKRIGIIEGKMDTVRDTFANM